MVRDGRVKFHYIAGSPDLYGNATTGKVDTYTNTALNGRIQSVYYEAGNWNPAGSLIISISGTSAGATTTEGVVLNMTSGATPGHHLGEDWILFPRASTVTTNSTPIINYSGPSPAYAEIPVYSILRVQAGVVGTGSAASGLTIVYI